MKCDVCGSDNLEGAAYCEDCGAKLVVVHAAAPAAPPPPAPPPTPAPVAVAPAPPSPAPAPVAPVAAATSHQCPSCGADNPAGEQYCVDCGANLGPASAPPAAPVAAAPAARASARLLLPASNKEYRLERDLTTMGRRSPADQIEPDVDLTDDDPESYVSRRHAQVIRSAGAFVFEDVGSSNGSFVNNVKVQPGVQQPLHDGDRIRLGKTEFVFQA